MQNLGNTIELLRQLRSIDQVVERGQAKHARLRTIPPQGYGVGVFILTVIVSYFGSMMFGQTFSFAIGHALTWGAIAACLYWSMPLWVFLYGVIRYRCLPDVGFLDEFSKSQKILSCASLSLALALAVNVGLYYVLGFWHVLHPSFHFAKYKAISYDYNVFGALTSNQFLVAWIVCFVIVGVGTPMLFNWAQGKNKTSPLNRAAVKATTNFKLWLGESTGWLSSLAHKAGMKPQQQIVLSLPDAAQNILILGAIGSGKTTRAMHPLLLQLLDQDCGGLIFDIKGDFQKAVLAMAKSLGFDISIIGPNHHSLNLLAGLTPEVASSFLKSVFILGSGNRNETFWIDTATELCRNILGILAFVPEHYSLHGLYNYLFNTETRLAVDAAINQLLPSLEPKTARLLNSYLLYQEKIFDLFDEKVKAGVNATIAQVLAPFNHPELIDAFCSTSEDNVDIEAVIDNAIYLVALPLAKWGLGAKVVYTLIKLRFFNVMQMRASQPDWNQERPVFFMCDEFQEIVSANKDGLSDLNFWDKSRSSKTIGIISAQAVSSFYATIGDRDVANALLQNFRQKICFRTEDITTLQYFHGLADKVEVTRITRSNTDGHSSSGVFGNQSRSVSSTENLTLVDKPVLDAQLFRSLNQEQAVALLSIGGCSMDDIVNMLAIHL